LRRFTRPAALVCALCLALGASGQKVQNERKPEFSGDLDGDKVADRILRAKYEAPALALAGDGECRQTVGHFVRYTLARGRQKDERVIFEHQYGSAEADFWSYGLKPAGDLNGDGAKDLIYYAGDDTGEEHVFLLQKTDGFKAVYVGDWGQGEFRLSDDRREILAGVEEGGPGRAVARWDAKREAFAGPGVNWVTGDCVKLRAEPSTAGKVLALKFQNNIVAAEGGPVAGAAGEERWQKVREGESTGFISARFLSQTSPTKEFK